MLSVQRRRQALSNDWGVAKTKGMLSFLLLPDCSVLVFVQTIPPDKAPLFHSAG